VWFRFFLPHLFTISEIYATLIQTKCRLECFGLTCEWKGLWSWCMLGDLISGTKLGRTFRLLEWREREAHSPISLGIIAIGCPVSLECN
jgi:hypothetical protein